MVEHDTTPLRAPGSEPVTDATFAARLTAQRKAKGITQQALADRASIHVTQGPPLRSRHQPTHPRRPARSRPGPEHQR